jgi:hypothetical protein
MNDLRKEQLVLLRFEKQIAGLAATLAAAGVVAKAVDGKLSADLGTATFASVQSALLGLAEATGAAHAALNAQAIEAGARILNASGGTGKNPPTEVVRSILGIG